MRKLLNSPRLQELKRRRRRVFKNKILLSIFASLVIFTGLAFLSHIPSLNITSIEIIGNKVTDTETIKTSAEKEISGKYLWFFPKTNILFYPKNTIKKNLNINFKRLKDINLSIKNNSILEIAVTEREALYTWCGEKMNLGAQLPLGSSAPKQDTCYFLDEAGFMFDEAPYFSGEVYFEFYGTLPSNFAEFILFKQTLETIGLRPVAFYQENTGSVRVFLSTSSRYMDPEIIFNADSNLETVAENLRAALTTEPLQSKFKNKYSSLEYIDLRFGNKVYFKFK